jgi:hypothetical protein
MYGISKQPMTTTLVHHTTNYYQWQHCRYSVTNYPSSWKWYMVLLCHYIVTQCNAIVKKTPKHPRTITPRIYKPTWKPQVHNKPKQVVSWNLKQSSSCKIWKLNTTKNKSTNSNNHIPFTWFSLVCLIFWDQIQNLCKLYPMFASLCHFFPTMLYNFRSLPK